MKSIIISIIQILFLVSPVSASERETDYIVTFYPESGSILQNISCKIVFTAEGIDKKKISITGVIINERGDTVQSVKTLLPGIGYFHIYANPGERYILKCENRDRIRKNFYLPMMSENGFGLKIIENKEQWMQGGTMGVQGDSMNTQGASLVCSKCNSPLPQGAKFCMNCGEKVTPKEVYCQECGAVMPANAQFCMNCGTRRNV